MNEIVWVYGASAAGKETFIKRITADSSLPIVGQLGWLGRKILVCQDSIDWIAQLSFRDENSDKRVAIPGLVTGMLTGKEDTVVLIKGKDVDLEDDLPEKLKEICPNTTHKILFLGAPMAELYSRIVKKKWWDADKDDIHTTERWFEEQILQLKKRKSEFEIIAIDSTTPEYNITALPQELQ